MTNKDFKEGMEVTCELANEKVYNASLKNVGWNNWYIHATRNGLTQDWSIGDGSNLDKYGVTNLQPKHRTIDDLECGDYVVDKFGDKKVCLGRCGKMCFLSKSMNTCCLNNWHTTHFNTETIETLKEWGYTLYQPTEEKEKTTRERILELMRDSDQEWACDEIIKLKETDIDKCIKVIEEHWFDPLHWSRQKSEIVQALKNLKK